MLFRVLALGLGALLVSATRASGGRRTVTIEQGKCYFSVLEWVFDPKTFGDVDDQIADYRSRLDPQYARAVSFFHETLPNQRVRLTARGTIIAPYTRTLLIGGRSGELLYNLIDPRKPPLDGINISWTPCGEEIARA